MDGSSIKLPESDKKDESDKKVQKEITPTAQTALAFLQAHPQGSFRILRKDVLMKEFALEVGQAPICQNRDARGLPRFVVSYVNEDGTPV